MAYCCTLQQAKYHFLQRNLVSKTYHLYKLWPQITLRLWLLVPFIMHLLLLPTLYTKKANTHTSQKKSTHHTWKLPIGDIVAIVRLRRGRRLGRFTSSVASSHPSILLERNRPKQWLGTLPLTRNGRLTGTHGNCGDDAILLVNGGFCGIHMWTFAWQQSHVEQLYFWVISRCLAYDKRCWAWVDGSVWFMEGMAQWLNQIWLSYLIGRLFSKGFSKSDHH